MRTPLGLEVAPDLDDFERVSPTRQALGLLELDVGLVDDDPPPVPARAADFVFVMHRIGLPQQDAIGDRRSGSVWI